MNRHADGRLRAEIDAVLAEWAWCVDHGDHDALALLFTEDARFTPAPGMELRGRDQIRERYVSRTGPRTTRHVYSGLRIESAEPFRVQTTSTWVCYAANAPCPVPEAPTYQVAEFHDTLTRSADGAWRISDRAIVSVFRDARFGPVTT